MLTYLVNLTGRAVGTAKPSILGLQCLQTAAVSASGTRVRDLFNNPSSTTENAASFGCLLPTDSRSSVPSHGPATCPGPGQVRFRGRFFHLKQQKMLKARRAAGIKKASSKKASKERLSYMQRIFYDRKKNLCVEFE